MGIDKIKILPYNAATDCPLDSFFMKKFLTSSFLVTALFAVFTFSASAQQTGNATAVQCVYNAILTGFFDSNNNPCTPVTPTDTPTPTPTDVPSVTPSTPPSDHGDGLSDGRSDGRSSCPECTKAPAVLGLSTTGSANNVYILVAQAVAALSLAAVGFKFFKKNA